MWIPKGAFLLRLSLIFEFFPKDPWGGSCVLLKIVAEGGSVFKTAGKSDLCNGIIGGAEHLDSHSEPVPEKILLGRSIFMLHKDSVQISPVYAHMSGNVRDPDIVAVVVLDVFFGRTEVFIRVVSGLFH